VTLRAPFMASFGQSAGTRIALSSVPAGIGHTQNLINGGALVRRSGCVREVQVQFLLQQFLPGLDFDSAAD
jgi:hypothetical protein